MNLQRSMRALFFHSQSICLVGLPVALYNLGFEIVETDYRPDLKGASPKDVDEIRRIIATSWCVDIVVTYDFCPAVSIVCNEAMMPYFSWIYDCPQLELYRLEAEGEYKLYQCF